MPLFDQLSALLLTVVITLVIVTFDHYGISWDEEGQNTYGHLLFEFYRSGFTDRSVFDFANLYLYGGSFDLLAVLLNQVSPFGEYETRKLLGGLVGVLGLAGTWAVARRLGGPRAGFLALLLLVLTPRYYGDMFVNPKDVPLACGVVWLIHMFLRVLDDLPRVRAATVAGLGLVLGLTLGTRIGGAIVLAFPLPSVLLWLAARWREDGARAALGDGTRAALRLLPALPLAYVVMVALWPWAVLDPLNPLEALRTFASFPFDGLVPFEGELIRADRMPRSYLPLMLAITLPELVLAGLAVAAGMGAAALLRRPGLLLRAEGRRLAVVAAAVAVPVLYFVLTGPPAYNGMRHYIFVLPPMAVLAGMAFDRLLGRTEAGVRPPLGRQIVAVPLAVAATLQAAIMAELHPNEYVFYNRLVGGVRGAEGRFEVEYWGTSLAEATRALVRHLQDRGMAGERVWRVHVCANPLSASAYFPPYLTLAPRREEADFQIALNQFYCASPPGSRRIATVSRAGATLSYVDALSPEAGADPGPARQAQQAGPAGGGG